jgi:UDP-N-acetylmuramate dehydrogenase
MKSMSGTEETLSRLAAIPSLQVSSCVPLSRYTRFGIGGPADIYAETSDVEAFIAAMAIAGESGLDLVVIGGGTNLIVSDAGFRGVVLRFVAERLMAAGNRIVCDAGVVLQDLVDFSIDRGLGGLETLAGIPGWAGAAVYGNAGAYGHSISERVHRVRFLDCGVVRVFDRDECEFRYRESIFKEHKEWIILSTELILEPGDAAILRKTPTTFEGSQREISPNYEVRGQYLQEFSSG